MLALPNVRITVLFESSAAIPDKVDIRLGAAGTGFLLPPHIDPQLAVSHFKKLTHSFSEQKAFVFAEGLDNAELRDAARANRIRFGTGKR